MARHILIVDDDALMRRSVSLHLEQNGYRTTTAASAEDALALARRDRPDLVLLDIGLPGMDGLQAIRHFQRDMEDVPVIFVTARRRELDTIVGLELGADDYITKPFNLDILTAHVRAILRRAERGAAALSPPEPLVIGDLFIDPAAHVVTVGGRPVDLTGKEFAVLHTLALEAGHVVGTEDILNRVWGAEFMGEPQVVYVNIRWLREKLESNPNKPRRIINVRGVGYKLVPLAADPPAAPV
ncbi:MAG: response regulator transcription factor [Anaerolineae bacterium]|uniref:response regulator transcription factor n=1 Tax=Promineifilum sp. TaxID=2664178 RepID=UPI001DB17ECB|nr:response regulator transcription factor [Anaerolineales bacterium]MCB8935972.1 response regulator transcription factor [Promineifilum sp.]MCO5182267.1 response regulator transcription factor [Promineifilum sp.]MCW5848209.1 response regulator transcription factor [Anaerolineae bacterium]